MSNASVVPPPLVYEDETLFSSPRRKSITMIVVHSISERIWWPEAASGVGSRHVPALEWLTKPVAGHKPVSAHCLIDPDGTVRVICSESKVAWHAGVSRYQGENNLNLVSLGVELIVTGEHNYASFLDAIKRTDCYDSRQIKALGWLIWTWMRNYPAIGPDRVVAHSTIAGDDVRGAGRGKRDPGDGLNWSHVWDEVQKWSFQETRVG